MRSLLWKTLLLAGASSLVCRMADDDSEPIGIIELEDNLSDVEKPAEIPAGRYKAEVQDVQLPTSAKGNQYFAVKFVIPNDELPKDVQDSYPDGAILYYNRVIVPTAGNRRAMWNLKQFMAALGMDVNTTSIDPNDWMGREATLQVRMGKYQGEERAEIGAVLAAEAKAAKREAAPKATGRGKRGR